MADTSAPTGVTAPVTETKVKKTRSPINQADLRKLATAEAVGTAAQRAEHAALLDTREISAAFVTGLLGHVSEARAKVSEVLQNRTASKEATLAQKLAEKALLAGLREVQKAAKQKYRRTNPLALADYLVGAKLNGNQPNLAQTSQTIIARLASDTLPGINAAKVTALGTARQNWLDRQAVQDAASSDAEDAATEFKALLRTVTDEKLAIQMAADAEWPHDEQEHSGLRKEFALPARRPAIA